MRSPLAPSTSPALPPIRGVRLAACNAGIRYKNRFDLLLVELTPGAAVAGVFTRSLTASAPVEWCRTSVAKGRARAIVVNAGNSNAFTGKAGVASVQRTVAAAAKLTGAAPHEIFIASTGVIGQPLPDEKITAALPALQQSLSEAAWEDAAAAILTTDTFKKIATRRFMLGDKHITLNGFAKGSGMIAPDMATMLAFLFTDAAIDAPVLQRMLSEVNDQSFNAITVDSDTSTSDTVLLCATGKAGNPMIRSSDDPMIEPFRAALKSLMIELAQLIVKDGEGASKFVSITVTGAEHDNAARRIALAIANSPLVKTAIAGEDANWGRIVMAVGKAGERADRDMLKIEIGGALVAVDGMVNPDYVEGPTAEYMKGQNIDISVDVGIASGKATVWTCDLTHGYIAINGSYRT